MAIFRINRNARRTLGGVLLIAGTAVGAGMLALPVATGAAGFIPSSLLFLFYSLYMTFTGLLMLEVCLWVGEGNNLISMARLTLGKWGQVVSWILYLFLLYSLTTAYLAGGAPLLVEVIAITTGAALPDWVGMLPLLLIFGFCVYRGARMVDLANRILMGGMVIAYLALVIFLTPHVQTDLLLRTDWGHLWMGLSVAATSFGFHIVIPSLATYLQRDVKQLRKVILIGSSIPLFIYLVWEFLALGIIPLTGEHGIAYGYEHGGNAATLLAASLHHSTLALATQFFSFFAIITSFLGVSLSLSDFLADGLKIQKTERGRALLYCLTFLPPLVITLIDPNAFLSALEYAGAFGVVTLLGLLPALMAWSGRYRLFLVADPHFQAPGGKSALVLTIILSLAIISYEIIHKVYGS